MTIRASTRQKTVAVLMVAASLVYLTRFVSRGWIPHDEGMLGQSAERVLLGQIPHIDYEEPYTGGLSWIYAEIFRVSGIELLHIRWVLFGVAVVAICILYSLLRRFVQPAGAAIGTWVGLAWSFPNYFAGLPSWWLLTCALGCVWAIVRYIETTKLRYGLLAGLAAGTAVAIKQTGIYLLVAVLLTMVYTASLPLSSERGRSLIAAAAALVSAGFAAALLMTRLLGAEGLYLFSPIAACSAVLLMRKNQDERPSLRLWLTMCAAAAMPMAVLLLPYAKHAGLFQFVYGAFVLPRKRLAYASFAMPPAIVIVTAIPLLWLLMPLSASMFGRHSRLVEAIMWAAAVSLPIWALWNPLVYQLIWQSTRGFAVLVPLAICYCLIAGHVQETSRAAVLYACATVLAWTALNQFPYATPIYFSYTTPLAVVAGVALASSTGSVRRPAVLPWALMVLIFALVSMHRSYVEQLGFVHVPRHFDAQLDLPRAHLFLERSEVAAYQETLALIEQHLKTGRFIAGPDSPELYYLTGTQSESGRLFDFFSGSGSDSNLTGAEHEWASGQVIVINHRPAFSAVPNPDLVDLLRKDFPRGQEVGRFEVRWR